MYARMSILIFGVTLGACGLAALLTSKVNNDWTVGLLAIITLFTFLSFLGSSLALVAIVITSNQPHIDSALCFQS